jgi:sporulation protein YlmC with PRC-barrel domain
VTDESRPRGRILHAQLHLLDRQVVDHRTGRMVAKVDDVELDLDGPVPVVTALLSGPGAWGARLPGVLGRGVTGIHRRLHPAEDPDPTRIDWSHVVEIDSAVHVDRKDLGPQALGRWLDEHFVNRIPGAGHAPD